MMIKKLLLMTFVTCAMLLASCEKTPEDNPNPNPISGNYEGTWVMNANDYSVRMVIKDGTWSQTEGDITLSGNYQVNNDVITFMTGDTLVGESRMLLFCHDNVLVLRYHSDMGEGWGLADEFGLFFRENSTVDANPSDIQGKWFWYLRGDHSIIRSCLEINGSNFDFIIPIWRERMKGTINYQNGRIHFNVSEFLTRDNLEEGNESLENLYLNWEVPGEDSYQTEPSFGMSFDIPFIANGDESFAIFANLPAYFQK